MSIKNAKKWLYEKKERSLYIPIFVFLITTAVLGYMIWKVRIFSSPKPLMLFIVSAIIALVWLLSFISGLMLWAWYFVWFRYLAYGAARLAAAFCKVLKNIFIQILIVLALASWAWVERGKILSDCDFEGYKNILRFLPFLKILLITASFFIIKRLIVSRKKIFISDFRNNTGKKELEEVINSIPARMLNEMHRLSRLLRDIDEAQPEPKMEVIPGEMDVWDMGKDFEEIIGPESSVEVHSVGKIPIKPIFNFFKKLTHGPVLSGGVTLKDDKNLVLTACLLGGRFIGSWEITVDNLKEYYNPPASEINAQLIEMTDILVCRIFTDLSRGASPRWQAMKRYTDGLRLYRETLRTQEKRIENLIKSKNSFALAVRSDERFYQCYYNFGIIYERLSSYEAAIAAFREALKLEAENRHCHFQLAYLYYEEEDYLDAASFCGEAISICPTDPEYWNLLATIKYYEWFEKQGIYYKKCLKIPRKIVQYFSTAAVLSWKALCKDALCGDVKKKTRDIALLCIRNLAVITGKMKFCRSPFLFRQALFLEPDSNDLYFELGKYYFCKEKRKKARKAFIRVFEHDAKVDDPFSYWALYLNINAKLQDKDPEINKNIGNIYNHFLDALAEAVLNTKEYSDPVTGLCNIYIDYYKLVSLISKNISRTQEDKLIKKILKYVIKLRCAEKDLEIQKLKKEVKAKLPKCDESNNFYNWFKSQIYIILNDIVPKSIDKNDINEITKTLKVADKIASNKKDQSNRSIRSRLNKILADDYFRKKEYCKAFNHAREAVRLTPYAPDVRYTLGRLYIAMDDFDQGIKELEIGLNLDQPRPRTIKDFLKEIGEAYKKRGESIQDKDSKNETFEKAIIYLEQYLNILNDKSSRDGEDEVEYINTLIDAHINLGGIYREIPNYESALSHFEIIREIADTCKKEKDKMTLKLRILIEICRTHIESGSFCQAKRIFEEYQGILKCKSNAYEVNDLPVEIRIYGMLAKEECSVYQDKGQESKDTNLEKEVNELNEKIKLLDEKEYECDQPRLQALYHEGKGRYYFKTKEEEKKEKNIDKAQQEYKISLSYMATARVYYHLARLYWQKAWQGKEAIKTQNLADARVACLQCRTYDWGKRYETQVATLLEEIENAREAKEPGVSVEISGASVNIKQKKQK